MILRRVTFWLLVTVFVASPVCLETIAYRSRGNPLEHLFLFVSLTEATFALLALWSIMFVRQEPVLVRIALFLMVIVCTLSSGFTGFDVLSMPTIYLRDSARNRPGLILCFAKSNEHDNCWWLFMREDAVSISSAA